MTSIHQLNSHHFIVTSNKHYYIIKVEGYHVFDLILSDNQGNLTKTRGREHLT